MHKEKLGFSLYDSKHFLCLMDRQQDIEGIQGQDMDAADAMPEV